MSQEKKPVPPPAQRVRVLTVEECREKLRQHFGFQPKTSAQEEAALTAILFCLQEGYTEMVEPFWKILGNSLCPWDGMMHRDSICARMHKEKMEEEEEEEEEVRHGQG